MAPSGAGRVTACGGVLATSVVLAALLLLWPLPAARPPRAVAAVPTRAVAGTAPAATPERSAQQQEDADHEQREEQEAEGEEAVPGAVARSDHPDHLGGLAALLQPLGDPLRDAQVVGANPDPDHRQDRDQHQADHHAPSHLVLLVNGSLVCTTDAAEPV